MSIAFVVLFLLAVAGALGLITTRNPIYSVLFLVLNFFCIGGLFLTLGAEFLFVTQIIVYAGAIMVLFLFVIMLLNLNEASMETFRQDWRRLGAMGLGVVFFGLMLLALTRSPAVRTPLSASFAHGKVEPIGMQLMTGYLFPFEMVSVILLAALMGAMIIAKRHN